MILKDHGHAEGFYSVAFFVVYEFISGYILDLLLVSSFSVVSIDHTMHADLFCS